MKILFVSDIVGQPGRSIVNQKLPELISKEKPEFVIANAENAAGGKGLTGPIAQELFTFGINIITLGNHSFDRKEIDTIIDDSRVLRPINYPNNVPGQGLGIYTSDSNKKIAVVNLMGRVYMPIIDCPFRKINEVLPNILKETKNIFVDFHAEITSEKQTMGWYLDGRVSAVIGTHTHIPTADERVLPEGTAYITDAGMSGPFEGVIGMDKEIIIKKYLTGIPHHFTVAKGKSIMQGCIIDIDDENGKACNIKRFSILE